MKLVILSLNRNTEGQQNRIVHLKQSQQTIAADYIQSVFVWPVSKDWFLHF